MNNKNNENNENKTQKAIRGLFETLASLEGRITERKYEKGLGLIEAYATQENEYAFFKKVLKENIKRLEEA